MTRAYVLMTAMPPTKGHLRLIEFASYLAEHVEVILCTQPGEPYTVSRNYALMRAVERLERHSHIHTNLIHQTLPQEPEGQEGFWDMWTGFLTSFGFQKGDLIVASERYGKTLAEYAGGVFMPYDIDREIYNCKATYVREFPVTSFADILPDFQKILRRTITVFGAESTGKTTLSRMLAEEVNGHWLFEYARPYLENTVNEITDRSMNAIWKGQLALQAHAQEFQDKPFIIQDTDLFSTVGYWDMWNMGTPDALVNDAIRTASDLYIITQSNIPFEPDPLRYGGEEREGSDEYWISVCEKYNLNYVVLPYKGIDMRLYGAADLCYDEFDKVAQPLHDYQRQGKEYELHG